MRKQLRLTPRPGSTFSPAPAWELLDERPGRSAIVVLAMDDARTEDSPFPEDSTRSFPTTEWSAVLAAGRTNCPTVAYALEKLCRTYWRPLYAFARRLGESPHDAEDATQSFFAHLFEKDVLKEAQREKGRFRSFLLAAFTNHLRNQWDRRSAKKRGGSYQIVSFDTAGFEENYRTPAAENLVAERLFDRQWALTVVETALERLRCEHESAGTTAYFEIFHEYLTRDVDPSLYERSVRKLQISEGAARVALHRLRRRFGTILRSEVAYTVSSSEEVEEELRYLLTTISE